MILARLKGALLLALLCLAPMGCAELTQEEQERLPAAKELVRNAPERLKKIASSIANLVKRGESLAVEIGQIKAKIDSGEFSPAELAALTRKLLDLVSEQQQIMAEISTLKSESKGLAADFKEAKDLLKDISKRNWLAGLRTVGELVGVFVLSLLGVKTTKTIQQRRAAEAETAYTRAGLDVLAETIEGLPSEASSAAKETVRKKLSAFGAGVKEIVHVSAKHAEGRGV